MRKLLRRLNALWSHRRMQEELADEMTAHREMMEPGRQRQFGNSLQLREQAADQWGWTWLEHFIQDLAYGLRSMRRSPRFSLTAIAVLALGIGVNLAEFHIFNAFLHRLSVKDPETLTQFFRMQPLGRSGAEFSLPEIDFYRRNNNVLSAVLSETDARDACQAEVAGELHCILVSGNFFDVLGIAPLHGRLLTPYDDQSGAAPSAVLGYDYWQSRYAGDPAIVSRTLRLNGRPFQVVGIAPPEFGGLGKHAQVWLSVSQWPYLTGDPTLLTAYEKRRTSMYGRLKPGVSSGAAEAQFRSLHEQLRGLQLAYVDASEWLKAQPPGFPPGSSASTVLLLSTCVILVLLVLFSACANLGNMLLARGISRQREIQIRFAVGAGAWRLIRQLMTEHLLLAGCGTIAALATGRIAATILMRVGGAPSGLRMTTDWRVVLIAIALGLGATLIFGLAPALQIVRRGAHAARSRKILVAVQVTASCVLLILSSFLMHATRKAFAADLAVDPQHIAIVDPNFRIHGHQSVEAAGEAQEIAARLLQVPGVESASVVTAPPLRRPRIERAGPKQLYVNGVDAAYFPAMRVPLLAGRIFAPGEENAMVVSESTARALWPNRSPLGKSLFISGQRRTVVGLVRDSGVNLLTNPGSLEVYRALDRWDGNDSAIVVRTSRNSAAMAEILRSASAAPGTLPTVFTLPALIEQRVDPIRKLIGTIAALAATASLLAFLGIFGLLAFTVAQRTREIGIRMALGAGTIDVLRAVVGQYTVPFSIGVVAAVALAAASIQAMRGLVFGLVPFDPAGIVGGLTLFGAVAIAGIIGPAHRALQVDPASAIRYD